MQNALSQQRRRAYLEALGIPVWVRREEPGQDNNTITQNIPPVHHPSIEESIHQFIAEPAVTEVEQSPPSAPEIQKAPLEQIDCSGMNWQALHDHVVQCQSCVLHSSRKQAILGVGHQSADLLVVSDAPSSEDDRQGFLFSDTAGQLLGNMLAAIGQNKNAAYISNTVKCRPPADRMPLDNEVSQCRPYLNQQIELLKPTAILILGRSSAQSLLQIQSPLSQLRGRIHQIPDSDVPTIVTYHPRNLLRQPADKRKAWQDLNLLSKLLEDKPS